MERILFLGDSITDAGRDYSDDRFLGYGYAVMIAGLLGNEKPGHYEVLNRGVSGNHVIDLYARCKPDCWNLQPDYVSILIGVNDVWHALGEGEKGVEAVRYKRVYDMIIEETLQNLPNCKIILIEPFILPGIATHALNYQNFYNEVALRRDITHELADKYSLPILELQNALESAAQIMPEEYWLYDGVHPTAAGHGLICGLWNKLFEEKFCK